jgi:hypothetical protein
MNADNADSNHKASKHFVRKPTVCVCLESARIRVNQRLVFVGFGSGSTFVALRVGN